MATGGSIESISIKGRDFNVASDADVSSKRGGWENEHQSNGNGTGRLIKTRVGWQLDGLAVEIDLTRDDAEFLQEIQDSGSYEDCTITYASGVTLGGRGQVVGETQYGSMATTASVTLSGPGKLVKQ